MKATLTYNLEDPDDKMAHLRAVKSTDMAIVLWELVHNFSRKYEDLDDELCNISNIMGDINSLLEAHNINVDELIV